MAAHARLSPSSAPRWVPCPASVALQDRRVHKSSFYMSEGTLAHLLAEYLLKDGALPDTHALGTTHLVDGYYVTVDQVMLDHVEYYVSYVKEYLDPAAGDMLLAEVQLPLPYSLAEHGTSDVVGYRIADKTLVTIDLKYGQGVSVDPVGNWQLIIYDLAAYYQWSPLLDIEFVEHHIAQPRKNNMQHERFAVDQLHAYRKIVMAAAAEVDSPGPRFGPGEKTCQWCDHAPKCKALADHAMQSLGADFDDLDALPTKTPATLTPEQIRAILDNAKLIQNWISQVTEYVNAELTAGRAFPGYKLVEGRSNRVWSDETIAAEVLLAHLKPGDVYKTSLISPAQAEKLIKKERKEVQDQVNNLITKPQAKPALAPESDKRPALTLDPLADFDDISN